LIDLAFAIPGDLNAHTGGYIYDRRLIENWREEGIVVHHLQWGSGFPFPSASEVKGANDDLAKLPDGIPVLIDGLALGAIPDVVATHASRLRLVGLVYHPLALESGEPAATRTHLASSERRALARMRRVVTTSRHTASTLAADYDVPIERILIAPPGTDPHVTNLRRRSSNGVPIILVVGAVIPRKGIVELLHALCLLTDIPWHCRIVGSLERAPDYACKVRQRIIEFGLAKRVTLCGELPDIGVELVSAAIFVHASHHEGFGMSVAEALRAGLPIVACASGAIPDLLSDGGILVPDCDHHAMADAIRSLLIDTRERDLLSLAAKRAAGSLPHWNETSSAVLKWVQNA